jgi:hypothetical protein
MGDSMDLIAYFQKHRRDAEEDLRFVESTGGFRQLQRADANIVERNIAEQQMRRLREQIAEFDRILDELRLSEPQAD